jgi:enoyl-CoA hydratase/carnithine racemase
MLRTDTTDHVTWVRFARPEKLNAFTIEGQRDLRIALERAAGSSDTRVVVLIGEGSAFSVGADRYLLDGSATQRAAGAGIDAGAEFERLVDALGGCPKPLIAAVNGLAVGLGCTLLLHCDLVVAARSARLRLPFTSMGITPEAASSVLLPARARWDEAVWAMLSSEWIEADRARHIGLVWRVVADDELVTETAAVASALAHLDPAAVVATKGLLTAGRREMVRTAHEREMLAMASLLGRSGPGTGSLPTDTRPRGNT